ncbi:energy-coupling factor ABC transporter permease [Methanosphaera sp. ISO3-F5]|uniref:energy-coupling factor ABC transporter permease n=1 Tax=Methanosphaera sp. ISO3-F5 TaxID=1452353 RepID=UPI002B257C93|nr:energy-coupling factor ABC transporter permease [Methanosphaera sp. ISO3-F5]WQH63725.1 energy-coupling factor ABC transporter permease [Methanosphaera sp. ISO3-F5]
MHLPDGIIPLDQAFLYWLLSIIILAVYNYKFSKNEQVEKQIVNIAIFSAIVLLLSSLSIPSPLGIPIHFFVIPIVVILLGVISATLCSCICLIGQALLLNMGGISSFGANFLVMGFILSIVTIVSYNIFLNIDERIAIFLSTIMGIISATFLQAIILVLSGSITFNAVISTLIPYYMFISVIEAILNVMIVIAIKRIKPDLLKLDKI